MTPIKLASLLFFYATTLSADTESYSLLQVEDGDTLVIDMQGNPTRIQLLGIDAPEDSANPKLIRDIQRTGQSSELLLELGMQASQHLQQLAAPGMTVIIAGELQHRDKYGRIPAVVTLPGAQLSLNAAMVQQGYAITLDSHSTGNSDQPILAELERQARENNRGLWQSHPELMRAWSGRQDSVQ
ncbi:MAG: thermonuclease family protein [Gammaproteobacteria bacterium]|nr:thermonuclease family protein [Gammaproteobacteria bacterium]